LAVKGIPKSKSVAFLHSSSGKANRLAYGTSVLHAGGAVELEVVTVIVPVVVTKLVTVLVLVVVLVQNSVLLHPVGQR
jgi:hypothetical protein